MECNVPSQRDAEWDQWYSANYSFVDKPAEATTQIMESLKDQIAVVTGASSGIGKAIALSLAAQGAEACLVARRRELLEDVAKQIHALGSRGHACPADLTKDEDIRGLGDRFQKDFGHVNVLVLCGGAIFQGQIVFINSSAGLRSPATAGQFAATQHAFRSIADSLRDEVNADGIRVLSVYPGRTATPRLAKLFEKEGRAYQPDLLMQAEDVAEMVTHSLRLPRTAEVTDITIRPMQKSY